jgi:hypothetical protein
MLDRDLAVLYGVETKNLNKAVRRNLERFPADFMFQLTLEEVRGCAASRFQFGTLKRGQNVKYLPYVFTQEGVAMLSGVLRSPRAVQVNIVIMRVFVRLREALALHKDLVVKLAELERRIEGHDTSIRTLFDAIRELAAPLRNAARGNRLPRQGRQPALPREKEMTMVEDLRSAGELVWWDRDILGGRDWK